MSPTTDNQNQDQSTCENTDANLVKAEKEKKSVKSNSELMAEFFAIASDKDKKECNLPPIKPTDI